MRFIIREQEFEKPLASGKFRYMRAGRPTGLTEEWRLTGVTDGYTFLRVDLDGRRSDSAASTLYHLTVNPLGQPERLKLRHYGKDLDMVGDVLFSDAVITASRQVKGSRFEEELTLTGEDVRPFDSPSRPYEPHFWFPSVLGLSLLAAAPIGEVGDLEVATLTLGKPCFTGSTPVSATFALRRQPALLTYEEKQEVEVGRQVLPARPLSIKIGAHTQRLWIGDWGRLPLRLERDDGLVATETYYIRRHKLGPAYMAQ